MFNLVELKELENIDRLRDIVYKMKNEIENPKRQSILSKIFSRFCPCLTCRGLRK